MRFIAKSLTLGYISVMFLFESFSSKCHCDPPSSTERRLGDDSYRGYIKKLSKSSNNRPPSIIDLRHHAYKYLPKRIFRHNDTEILDLGDNRLTSLPRDLANLTKLGYINLEQNRFTNISYISVITKLPRLKSLLLSKNPLKSLRGLHVNSLLTLEANHCEIKELDELFLDSLPSLRTLNLTGNPLGTVRKLMSGNLIDLVLTNCRLTSLPPDAFEGLSNLQFLDLRGNALSTMPDKIFACNKNLVYLTLGNNTFEKIKNIWFDEKLQLSNLDFSKNEIKSIDDTTFQGLPALVNLNLGENKVTDLPSLKTAAIYLNLSNNYIENQRIWNLSDMPRIRRLDLSRNRLNDQCDEFQSNSLRILDLGFNNITTITKESLTGLPNLVNLNLKGNRFYDAIDPLIFDDNKILVEIELDENPWNCNCTELYPIYFYLANEMRTRTANLICHSPKQARGNTWWDTCSYDWKRMLMVDDSEDVTNTWIIAISSVFGACLILGTICYIVYTFKRNRSSRNS